MKNYLIIISIFCSNLVFGQNLKKDMATILTYFEGEFDNFQQIYAEKQKNTPDSLVHERIHSVFKRVEMPEVGKNVLYVKQYADGDTNKIYRQRIYTFLINEAAEAVQLDVWSFPTPEIEKKYAQATITPEMFKVINKTNLRNDEGCSIFWKGKGKNKDKSNTKFVGRTNKNCAFLSKRLKTKIIVSDSLQLNESQLSIHDVVKDASNHYVFVHKSKIPFLLKKCRFFNGTISVKGDTAFYPKKSLRLHDLGQKIRFTLPDGTPTKYTTELRQMLTNEGIVKIELNIYEDKNEVPIATTWVEQTAKKIVIDTETVKAAFELEE
jgi:hypothetical protein